MFRNFKKIAPAALAALLTTAALPSRAQVMSLFFAEAQKDGVTYCFNNSDQYKTWKESGDMGKSPMSVPEAGANGGLLVCDSEAAVDLYNLKHDKAPLERAAPKNDMPKGVTWKPGGGIDFKLSNFELKIGMRAQFQAVYDNNEYCGNCTNTLTTRARTTAATGATAITNSGTSTTLSGNPTLGESYSTTTLSVRRVKPYFQGWAFSPKFKYDIQLETTQGGSGTNLGLREALVDAELGHGVTLRVGQWKGPYGRQRYTSDSRQMFVEPALVTSTFAMGFEDGVMLIGNAGGEARDKFEYNIGIFNGTGQNPNSVGGNTDNKLLYALRGVWTPFGKYDYAETAVDNPQIFQMYVGGSWNTNTNKSGIGTASNAETKTDKFGIELGAKYKIWSFNGEYFRVKTQTDTDNYSGIFNPATGVGPTLISQDHVETNARGWFAQTGLFAIPSKLEFAIRFAEQDPNRDVGHQKTKEFRLGTNYYLSGNHYHKLQFDIGTVKRQYNGFYVNTPTTAAPVPPAGCAAGDFGCDDHEIKETQYRLMYQFMF